MDVPADADLREDVVRLIVESAKKGQTITYGEIMRKCRIPRGQPTHNGKAIGDVVGRIREWTWENRGIYLSAIVVHKDTGYPGGGFFGLSGIPSKFARDEAGWSDRKLTTAEKSFLSKRQQEAFAWAKGRKVV